MTTIPAQARLTVAAIATVCVSWVAAHSLRGALEQATPTAVADRALPRSADQDAAGVPVVAAAAGLGDAASAAGDAATAASPDAAAAGHETTVSTGRPRPPAAARSPRATRPAGTAAAVEPRVANVLAREALRDVGKDPAALAIWLRAINDPDLPSGDRSDLIEDLNDEGYDGQGTYTEADLRLILARLELIERLMPLAMDNVNAVAFTEAYKDLLNMLAKARVDVAARNKR